MDEIEDLEGESETEALSRLVKGKRPKKNPKAEVEKKEGDRQRSDVRMRGYKPLPVQLRGYAFDIKSAPDDFGDHLGGRVREHGDIDTSAMIDRMLATKPPESDPTTKRLNGRFTSWRKEAVKRFKSRQKKEVKKRWKAKKS